MENWLILCLGMMEIQLQALFHIMEIILLLEEGIRWLCYGSQIFWIARKVILLFEIFYISLLKSFSRKL